jgi:IMP dehydrogenase/GMP reductase
MPAGSFHVIARAVIARGGIHVIHGSADAGADAATLGIIETPCGPWNHPDSMDSPDSMSNQEAAYQLP